MIKIFFTALFFLILNCVKAQYGFPIPINDGGKPNILINQGTYGTLTGFTFLRNFSDTTDANGPSYIKNQPGIVVLVNGSELWVRNQTANAWTKISGSGGGFTTANNGVTSSGGTTVQLGQTFNQSGNPSVFTSNRELYTNFNQFKIRGDSAGNNYFLINYLDNNGIVRIKSDQLLETLLYGEGNDYGFVKIHIRNVYDSTGIHVGYSSAASGVDITNAVGTSRTIIYNSYPGNAFIDNGTMIWALGTGGYRMTASSGPITFTNSSNGSGEYARFNNHRFTVNNSFLVNDTTFLHSTAGTPDSLYGKLNSDGRLVAVALSDVGQNIYNTDGVLTSERTLSGAEYTYGLTFDKLLEFKVNAQTTEGTQGTFDVLSSAGRALLKVNNGTYSSYLSLDDPTAISMAVDSSGVQTLLSIKGDSAYLIYSGRAALSSSSLTGYNLLMRNSATGSLIDYTGAVGGSSLTVGTTSITSGTSGRVLYDNAGTLGEYSLGAGISTWWATPSSANLATAVTDETGTAGALVFSNTPTLTTPLIAEIDGSTSSGGTLTLKSTTHATKGKILFGTSAYDEVNNRLGIGNTSPVSTLDIGSGTAVLGAIQTSSTGANSNLFTGATTAITGTTGSAWLYKSASTVDFRVGINGSTSSTVGSGRPYASFEIAGTGVTENSSGTHPLMTQMAILQLNITNGSASTTDATSLYIQGPPVGVALTNARTSLWVDAGTVQIDDTLALGTAAPSAQLHTTGSVRFQTFGAGTLTTDASGNLSVTSDERLKHVTGYYQAGLKEIMNVNPIMYTWNEKSGLDMSTNYIGFSAQNIRDALGKNAVGITPEGYLTLNDRSIIAALVNAIKEQQAEIEKLKTKHK